MYWNPFTRCCESYSACGGFSVCDITCSACRRRGAVDNVVAVTGHDVAEDEAAEIVDGAGLDDCVGAVAQRDRVAGWRMGHPHLLHASVGRVGGGDGAARSPPEPVPMPPAGSRPRPRSPAVPQSCGGHYIDPALIPLGGMGMVIGMAGYEDKKAPIQQRLRRIEGQVRGVQRMVDEDAYCIDVLTQISAATKALQAVALELLDEHLAHCVADAMQQGGDAGARQGGRGVRRDRAAGQVVSLLSGSSRSPTSATACGKPSSCSGRRSGR